MKYLYTDNGIQGEYTTAVIADSHTRLLPMSIVSEEESRASHTPMGCWGLSGYGSCANVCPKYIVCTRVHICKFKVAIFGITQEESNPAR